MAIKIKKKGEQAPEELELTGDPLLDEPDQFFQAADASVSWASQNQQMLIMGIGGVVVAVLVVVFLVTNLQKGKMETSAALTSAVEALNAPVGEAPTPAPGSKAKDGLRYSTAKQKYTEVDTRAQAVIDQHGGTPAAQMATLIKARAAHGLGNHDEAIKHYQAWLAANGTSPEKPLALLALANSQAAAGQVDAAIESLKQLKAFDEDSYGEMASLQIAQTYEAAGQKDKAKGAYEEMLKAYPDSNQIETVKLRLDLM